MDTMKRKIWEKLKENKGRGASLTHLLSPHGKQK